MTEGPASDRAGSLAAAIKLQIVDKLFCCAEAAVRLSGVKFQSEFHSRP